MSTDQISGEDTKFSFNKEYFLAVVSSFTGKEPEEVRKELDKLVNEMKTSLENVVLVPAIERRLYARAAAVLILKGINRAFVNKVTKSPPTDTRPVPVSYLMLSTPSNQEGEVGEEIPWHTIGLRLIDEETFEMSLSKGTWISLEVLPGKKYTGRIDFYPPRSVGMEPLRVEFTYSAAKIEIQEVGEVEEFDALVLSQREYEKNDGTKTYYLTIGLPGANYTMRAVSKEPLPLLKPVRVKGRAGNQRFFIDSFEVKEDKGLDEFKRDFLWLMGPDVGAGVVDVILLEVGDNSIVVSDGEREVTVRLSSGINPNELDGYLFQKITLIVEKTPPREVQREDGTKVTYPTTAWVRGVIVNE